MEALCHSDKLNIAVPLHGTDFVIIILALNMQHMSTQSDMKVVSISLEVQHTNTEKAVLLYLC